MRLRVGREISREEVRVLFALGYVEGRDFLVCRRSIKPGQLVGEEALSYSLLYCEHMLDRPSTYTAFLLSPAGEDILDEDELADRSDE